MATPQVPPRPARPSHSTAHPAAEAPSMPQVPPRPSKGRHDRSISPESNRYAQSPLNAPFMPAGSSENLNPYENMDRKASMSNLDLAQHRPSVSLPSVGQEGNEYESYSEYEAEPLSRTISAVSHTQATHVGTDLPLHAPKPALSQSEARARVQGVTHSDNTTPSSPAGRRLSAQLDDKDPQWRPLRSRGSLQLRSPSASEHERPGSAQAEDHGIPMIGTQVPMYRFAGDVQAPSPAPLHSATQEPGGRSRHHQRTRSGRDQSNPPDSYGRHGHGVTATDKFEKDWYAKHPEARAKEGVYSQALHGRGEYVLSSEELNKLVRGSGKDAGFGTAPNVVGLPDEQIGYIASEEYASRMSRPGSAYSNLASPQLNQTKFETVLQKAQAQEKGSPAVNELTRQTTGDSEIIHVDTPEQHWSKVTGEGTTTPPVDLGPHGGNTSEQGGFIDEQGYGIPILASDGIRPESAWQRPAILPNPHDRAAQTDLRNHFGNRPVSTGHSRPGSRPGSIHGMTALSRYISHEEQDVHTPLDDVEEYEPLFNDDKESAKPITEAARLKHRPDLKHRFPSQDIWEDSPDSSRLETEVDETELEPQQAAALEASSSTFESPEAEAARKGEATEAERKLLVPREEQLMQSDFKPQIRRDLRRPSSHRFPSSDVWEDSPDSARLEATVGDNEAESGTENPATVAGAVVTTTTDRDDLSGATPRHGATTGEPMVPQRPVRSLKHKSSQPKEYSHLSEVYTASSESQSSATESQQPSIDSKKPPIIPTRPKPHVPARPTKAEGALVSEEEAAASPPKAKPPIPAKPLGSKIAALQAGFMSDLNNRLKLGPQAPPKAVEPEKIEEAEQEKAPLEDARKGRTRGPARRKPAAAATVSAPTEGKKMPKLSFATPVTVWHISPKGTLDVVYETPEPPSEEQPQHRNTTITERTVDSQDESDHSIVPTKSAEMPSVTATTQQDLVLGSETESIGINPLPASSGPGNPISIPAGEPLPPHTQSVTDRVTLDQESYENAGPGTAPPEDPEVQDAEAQTLHKVTSPAQTGIKDIEINPNTPGAQKLTVIEGGNAHTGEDVVIKSDVSKSDGGHTQTDASVEEAQA